MTLTNGLNKIIKGALVGSVLLAGTASADPAIDEAVLHKADLSYCSAPSTWFIPVIIEDA